MYIFYIQLYIYMVPHPSRANLDHVIATAMSVSVCLCVVAHGSQKPCTYR